MPKQVIQPQGLPKPPTYSHVVKAGNTVYFAGQVAQDAQGNLVGVGDVEAQAVRVFENLKLALASVNATFGDLVKITVFVTDPRFREKVGEVRARYLKEPFPASTFLVVSGLARPELLLEIEATAYIG
ncbi:MAG: RidA family protein [Candidatus Tectomicrobia bacterium]|nr:RidA family protein [Candidatus Tectomicrobia bacterium]